MTDTKSFAKVEPATEFQKAVFLLRFRGVYHILVPSKNYTVSYGDLDTAQKEANYQVGKGFKLTKLVAVDEVHNE